MVATRGTPDTDRAGQLTHHDDVSLASDCYGLAARSREDQSEP